MAIKVSIVILNYKNWQDTVECLDSVMKITYQNYRVIVVDNDSRNESLEHIERGLFQQEKRPLRLTQQQSETGVFDNNSIVLIQSASNHGYAAGNNIGIRWALRAGDEYVLILNNDTIAKENFLEPLVEFLNSHSDTAMVGPKILDLDGNIDRTCARRRSDFYDFIFRIGILGSLFPDNYWHRKQYYIGEYDYSVPRQVEVLSGSCILICCNFFERIGLFDENTFLFWEEGILAEKSRKTGMKIYVIPSSVIIHKFGQTIKKRNNITILKIGKQSLNYYLKEYSGFGFLKRGLIMLDQQILYRIRLVRGWMSRRK